MSDPLGRRVLKILLVAANAWDGERMMEAIIRDTPVTPVNDPLWRLAA